MVSRLYRWRSPTRFHSPACSGIKLAGSLVFSILLPFPEHVRDKQMIATDTTCDAIEAACFVINCNLHCPGPRSRRINRLYLSGIYKSTSLALLRRELRSEVLFRLTKRSRFGKLASTDKGSGGKSAPIMTSLPGDSRNREKRTAMAM
jgi:hypothetical protein